MLVLSLVVFMRSSGYGTDSGDYTQAQSVLRTKAIANSNDGDELGMII